MSEFEDSHPKSGGSGEQKRYAGAATGDTPCLEGGESPSSAGDRFFEGVVGQEAQAETPAGDASRESFLELTHDRALRKGKMVPGRGRGSEREGGAGFLWAIASAAAAAVLVLSVRFTRLEELRWGFWLLLTVFVLTQQFRLKLKGGGDIKLGFGALVMALIPSGLVYVKRLSAKAPISPVWVIWIFLMGSLLEIMVRLLGGRVNRDELMRILMDYVGVGLGVLLFHLLVSMMWKGPEFLGDYWPGLLLGAGVASVVFYTFQLFGSAISLSREGYFPTGVYLSSLFRRSWIPFLALTISGFLGGLFYIGAGSWSSLFALVLLLVLAYTYNRLADTDSYLLETMRVLSSIPEKTGFVPEGHSSRIAWFSGAIARELGLSPEDVNQVEYAAYLHEAGIFKERGQVEGEERGGEARCKKSSDIIGSVDYLRTAAEILKGREGLSERIADPERRKVVDTGAGILRAVDDFDSLILGDQVRRPLSVSEALSEMNLERGIKYESKVLRAMSRVLSRTRLESVSEVGEWYPESPPPGGA